MSEQPNAFLKLVAHPFKFRLFLITKLPAAYFSGVRVKEANDNKCIVAVPYKWFSKNPFKSTYFACLSMAAEMSTGLLAMANTYGRSPAVSMLVVHLEAEFLKKATGVTLFTCRDGEEIRRAVDEAVASGEATSFRAKSVGTNENGEVIAEFYVSWSFKAKRGR